MSARHLRNALKGTQEPELEMHSEEEEEAEVIVPPNRFAHLLLEEGDVEEEENEVKETPKTAEQTRVKTKKRHNKKKKNAKKASEKEEEDDDDWQVIEKFAKENKEREEAKEDSSTTNSAVLVESTTVDELMRLDFKRMDAERELNEIINQAIGKGRATVPTALSSTRANRRKDLSYAQNRIIRPEQFADRWEPYDGVGITMEKINETDDGKEFVYRHARNYQILQNHFWRVADSGDNHALFDLLQTPQFAWHVDFNIQVAVGLFMQDNKDVAIVKLAKAIYTLEIARHAQYRLGDPRCSLPYKYRENRAMHIALLRHATTLQKRECPRAALEVCKALYTLEANADPLGAIYLLDALAIRSRQFEWFEQLFEAMKKSERHQSATLLPSMLFSRALAMHLASRNAPELAENATLHLKEALRTYPTMLPHLFDRCSVEPDANVAKCTLIMEEKRDNIGCRQLLDVYAHRMADLWKVPSIMSWLASITNELLEEFNKPSDYVHKWRKLRQDGGTFAHVPIELQRHMLLSWDLQSVPWHMIIADSSLTMAYDPFPPADTIAGYERQRPEVHAGMEAEMDDGFLAALLRSLNVNYDPAQVTASSTILCKLTIQHGHDIHGILDWALRAEPRQAREDAEDEEVD